MNRSNVQPYEIQDGSASDHALKRDPSMGWTRRAWLAASSVEMSALLGLARFRVRTPTNNVYLVRHNRGGAGDGAGTNTARMDLGPVQALAQRAVEAAHSAGAIYADARLTRTVEHNYRFALPGRQGRLAHESEVVGCGVRALVNGCWGFASAPLWLSETDRAERVVHIARAAVTQAKTAATSGPQHRVEMSATPAVTGTWETPCRIDPFSISVEEKLDMMAYWQTVAEQAAGTISPPPSFLHFARQERVLATSDGSLVTQTCYESGGQIVANFFFQDIPLRGVWMAGQGWERLLDARIPEQLQGLRDVLAKTTRTNPVSIGRYTLVCDGATMGSVLGETLGIATQVDRALGYPANTGGTSFLNDPLAMLGTFQMASPVVTVTANRSAPAQLATVRWDDESVVPPEITLVKNGVLHDFQTTREQSSWLAPYYQRAGRAVASNGCAIGMTGLHLPVQMRPNFALAPSAQTTPTSALVASAKDGIFVEDGVMEDVDVQARNGVLRGTMHRIVGGKLTYGIKHGAVRVNTLDFWKNVQVVGDASTADVYSVTQYGATAIPLPMRQTRGDKGRPLQRTSYSAQGVAAVVANQAVFDPTRKA